MRKTFTTQPISKLFIKLFTFLFFLGFSSHTFGQSTIYLEDFGTGTSLPTGWSTSSSYIYATNANPSNVATPTTYTNPTPSGGGNLEFNNNAVSTETITFNGTSILSTSGYTAIKVIWGARFSNPSNFPALTAEWSTNGTTWTNLNYTEINQVGRWKAIAEVSLPAGAENAATLSFRFSFTGDGSGSTYSIDDFRVQGTQPVTFFYSVNSAGADLSSTGSWNTQLNGSGSAPNNFSTSGSIFYIRTGISQTFSADWAVSPSSSKVVVQSGATLTIPSLFTFTGLIDVNAGGTVIINNTTIPTLNNLSSTSTVVYSSASSQLVASKTYGNLTISNGDHTLGGSTQVDGILDVGSTLAIGSNNVLTLNGTSVGTGELQGDNSSTTSITIGGTGSFGNLILGSTTGTKTFGSITINRGGTGTVTLGSSLTVLSRLNLDNGSLVLGANTLALSGASVSGASLGKLRGSSSSNLTFSSGTAGTSGGTIAFESGYEALNNYVSNKTVTLNSNLTINGTANFQSSSSLTIGTNALTFNGTVTAGGGTISSSSGSVVTYSKGISGQKVLPGTYGDLTFDGFTKDLSSASAISIAGTFTTPVTSGHTTTGNTITFNGTSSQTIPAFNYNNLTSSSSGARTLASTGTIGIAGSYIPGTNSYTVTGSTIDYNGTGAQTITGANYNNLTISGAKGSNTITLGSGTIDVAGTFSVTASGVSSYVAGSGTFNFSGSGSQAIPAINYNNITNTGNGNRTLASSGTIGIAGSLSPGSGTYTTTGSTVNYNGIAQTVGAISYNNLTFSNSGIKTISGTTSATGNLVISGTAVVAPGSNTINVGGNWTSYGEGGFTEATSTVVFNGGSAQTIITAGGEIFNSITIANTSGGVSLSSDSASVKNYLTVNSGTFTTADKLRLISTATQTASLIDNASTVNVGGSISGNLIDERYMSEVRSDTIYPRIASYFSAPVYNIFADQLQSTALNFFYYEEAKTPLSGTYANYQELYTKVYTPSSEHMTPGKGYSIRIDRGTTVTKSFYGQPNNGTISLPVTYNDRSGDGFSAGTNGLNLVGNPYPSAILWDATIAKTHINPTIYTWNGKQNLFWNGTTGNLTNGIIGSGQGFFVQANASSPVLTLTNANRVSSAGANNTHYRVAGQEKPPVVKIEASGNNNTDETYLLFTKEATLGFDDGFGGDGYKLNGLAAVPNIWTKSGDLNLCINALPFPTTETIIPLGIQVGANGKYEFTASLSDFDNSNLFVYLEDKELNVTQNLKSNPTYSFSRTLADTSARFNLIFKTTEIVTSLNDITVETENIKITSFDGTASINSNKGLNKATIIVVDAMGNMLYKVSDITSTGNYTIDLSKYATGIYIIKVLTSGASKIEKVKNW